MINRDGLGIIVFTGVVLILFCFLTWYIDSDIVAVLTVILAFVFVFHFFFFRDPDRMPPEGDHLLVAPADGKVIKIDTVKENLYVNDEVYLVSIFMSVFNVHVNRIPLDGTVEMIEHRKGRFLAAWAEEAIEHNEQTIIGLKTAYGKILFRQIAGLIARRIICRLKEGQQVLRGSRFGLIKYGSRVDLYLPKSITLRVQVGDKVTAGQSVIGEF